MIIEHPYESSRVLAICRFALLWLSCCYCPLCRMCHKVPQDLSQICLCVGESCFFLYLSFSSDLFSVFFVSLLMEVLWDTFGWNLRAEIRNGNICYGMGWKFYLIYGLCHGWNNVEVMWVNFSKYFIITPTAFLAIFLVRLSIKPLKR